MITRLSLVLIKFGILSVIGLAIWTTSASLGLPIGDTWFDGFVVGYGLNVVVGSAVSSMVEPDEDSSKLYIFLFRYGHAIFNRSTTYFTHKSMWKLFTGAKDSK